MDLFALGADYGGGLGTFTGGLLVGGVVGGDGGVPADGGEGVAVGLLTGGAGGIAGCAALAGGAGQEAGQAVRQVAGQVVPGVPVQVADEEAAAVVVFAFVAGVVFELEPLPGGEAPDAALALVVLGGPVPAVLPQLGVAGEVVVVGAVVVGLGIVGFEPAFDLAPLFALVGGAGGVGLQGGDGFVVPGEELALA